MTPDEMSRHGGRHVTAWLTDKGYQCKQDTQLPGSTDIEARSDRDNRLIQVKTALVPNRPSGLSLDEARDLAARARHLGYEAWCAKVQIGPQGQRVGDIIWIKLN